MGTTRITAYTFGRCLLTGEPLLPPSGASVRYNERSTSNGRVVPMMLHSHTMTTDDSFAWTKAFSAFLGSIVPLGIVQEWSEWREWHANPYIVSRLIARFGDRDVTRAIGIYTGRATDGTPAQRERARRRIMRAVRSSGGYLPNSHRPVCGRSSTGF